MYPVGFTRHLLQHDAWIQSRVFDWSSREVAECPSLRWERVHLRHQSHGATFDCAGMRTTPPGPDTGILVDELMIADGHRPDSRFLTNEVPNTGASSLQLEQPD